MEVAPPEDRLHPSHERHAAVVPEHVAELGVDPALYGVVGARQWTLCGQGRVKVGKERSLRDESRERRPRPPEPSRG